MTTDSYARAIRVGAAPDAVYQALTVGFEHWWTKPDRPLVEVGDIAKFSFAGRKGFWSFEARVLRPDRVELVCVEALHVHEGYPRAIETEWLGTTAIWQLEPDGDGTEIRFEHAGLTPDLHCFEICEAGWDRFFVGSLKAYLDTGRGAPFEGN
ncbi:MAG: SRPBCC domain-containing protein [Pseudomonadota bacterium]